MRRHLPCQVSCMFPFELLALALCWKNSLQNPLLCPHRRKILPGLTEVGNFHRSLAEAIRSYRRPQPPVAKRDRDNGVVSQLPSRRSILERLN